MKREQELERHALADGGTAILSKFARKYHVVRIYPSVDQPPDAYEWLSKEEAYEVLGDILKEDVCQ